MDRGRHTRGNRARQSHNTPRRLDDEQGTDPAHDDIRRCSRTRTRHEFAVLDDDVGGCRRAQDGEDHVNGMKEAVPRPRTAEGIEKIRERKPKAEVDSALQLRVEDAEGRRVELKDGEGDGEGGDDLFRPSRIVNGIRFAVIFFEDCFGSLVIGHRVVHILLRRLFL